MTFKLYTVVAILVAAAAPAGAQTTPDPQLQAEAAIINSQGQGIVQALGELNAGHYLSPEERAQAVAFVGAIQADLTTSTAASLDDAFHQEAALLALAQKAYKEGPKSQA